MKTLFIVPFAALVALITFSVSAADVPPLLNCPDATNVLCNSPVTLTAEVFDADGDALTVTWTVNGAAVQTNELAATNTLALQTVPFTVVLPFGTNQIGVSANDTAGNTISCS